MQAQVAMHIMPAWVATHVMSARSVVHITPAIGSSARYQYVMSMPPSVSEAIWKLPPVNRPVSLISTVDAPFITAKVPELEVPVYFADADVDGPPVVPGWIVEDREGLPADEARRSLTR